MSPYNQQHCGSYIAGILLYGFEPCEAHVIRQDVEKTRETFKTLQDSLLHQLVCLFVPQSIMDFKGTMKGATHLVSKETNQKKKKPP